MLQVICIIFSSLKSSKFTVVLHNYIAMSSHCDYISFDAYMTFIYTMHCSSFYRGLRIKHVQHFLLENYSS